MFGLLAVSLDFMGGVFSEDWLHWEGATVSLTGMKSVGREKVQAFRWRRVGRCARRRSEVGPARRARALLANSLFQCGRRPCAAMGGEINRGTRPLPTRVVFLWEFSFYAIRGACSRRENGTEL